MRSPSDESIAIRRAVPADAAALTSIAHAAKRHWGYPESWILRWQVVLTITPGYIESHPTFVARADAAIAGFCAVVLSGPVAVLDHVWVRPGAMRRGVGRALFLRAEQAARDAGATRLRITGDPHAEGFYLRMGATLCGREDATMDGQPRSLPLLEKALSA